MNLTELWTAEIDGKIFTIAVSNYGIFSAHAKREGDNLTHDNLVVQQPIYEKLLVELRQKARVTAARVSVPFVTIYQGHTRHGIARGLHATQQKVLVTWGDGTKDTLERYERDTYSPMPPEVETEINRLSQDVVVWRAKVEEAESKLKAALKLYRNDGDRREGRLTLAEQVKMAIAAAIKTDVKEIA